ncbi:MAG: hypothetical protein ACJA1I_000038 [Zhongshania marina]
MGGKGRLGGQNKLKYDGDEMAIIEFSKEEKDIIIAKVQRYFEDELHQDLGKFDAEFLTDFFSEEIGAYFYNRGLNDAKMVLEDKLVDIGDALYEIEKPTKFVK